MAQAINAAAIKTAMSTTWADPEYAVLFEVGEKTGGGGRRADAVIMSLWPSRGLELHGVEIKVSRTDWKRESVAPEKAEAIARFCDRWYIHTPPGIVGDVSELPQTWGLREWDGKRWRTRREAEKLSPVPVSRQFLAALLRKADRNYQDEINTAVNSRMAIERERMDQQIAREVKDAVPELGRATELIAEVYKELGVDMNAKARRFSFAPDGEIRELIKIAGMLKRSGAIANYQGLAGLSTAIRKIANDLDGEIAKIGASE